MHLIVCFVTGVMCLIVTVKKNIYIIIIIMIAMISAFPSSAYFPWSNQGLVAR